MKVGNPQVVRFCWSLQWGNKIRTPSMLQIFFDCNRSLLPLEQVRVKNLDLHPQSGCAYGKEKIVYDNAIRKSLTFQIQRLHRKKCRQWKGTTSSGNILHTRHVGKSCKACLRTLASPCINTLHWMSLPRCLKHFFEVTLFTGTPETFFFSPPAPFFRRRSQLDDCPKRHPGRIACCLQTLGGTDTPCPTCLCICSDEEPK